MTVKPMSQEEIIIKALKTMGGERHHTEVAEWARIHEPNNIKKDYRTAMGDMVHPNYGGNKNRKTRGRRLVLAKTHPATCRLLTPEELSD